MADLMALRRRILIAMGGEGMTPIYTTTIAQAYTGNAKTLYQGEIKGHVSFGNWHKICICVFEGNTYAENPINVLFFSLATDIESVTSSTRNGGMIRQGYTNIRSLDLTNDARVSAGTILKIYTVDI